MYLWDWAAGKVSSFVGAVKSGVSYATSLTISSATSLVNFTGSLLKPLVFSDKTYDFIVQFLPGFRRISDPNIVKSISRSNRIKIILAESLRLNAQYYLGLVLLYDINRQLFLYICPEHQSSTLQYAGYSIDQIAYGSFTVLAAHRFIDNLWMNIALAKEVIDANPNDNPYEHCGHDAGAVLEASLESAEIYLGNRLAFDAVTARLPMGHYLGMLGYPLIYGYGLVEFQLASAGNCINDRWKEIIKNNAYAYGVGVSFYGIKWAAVSFLQGITGRENYFIDDAVGTLLYQYYIIAMLLNEERMPGERPGNDYFFDVRTRIQARCKQAINWLMPRVAHVKSGDTGIDWKKLLTTLSEYRFVQHTKNILLYDPYSDYDFRTLEKLQARPSMIMFFDAYYRDVRQYLNTLIDYRDKPLLEKPVKDWPLEAAKLIPKLPNGWAEYVMSDVFKKTIDFALDEDLKDPLVYTRDGLQNIRDVHLQIKGKDERWKYEDKVIKNCGNDFVQRVRENYEPRKVKLINAGEKVEDVQPVKEEVRVEEVKVEEVVEEKKIVEIKQEEKVEEVVAQIKPEEKIENPVLKIEGPKKESPEPKVRKLNDFFMQDYEPEEKSTKQTFNRNTMFAVKQQTPTVTNKSSLRKRSTTDDAKRLHHNQNNNSY